MEKVKIRIQKISRILMIICRIARVIMFVSIGVVAVLLIGACFSDEIMQHARNILQQEEFVAGVLSGLRDNKILGKVSLRTIVIVSGLIHILSRLVFVLYLNLFKNLLEYIANGDKPFTVKNAKRIRRISYTMLILIFYTPLIAVTLFFVMLFFSYLFEYGAFLQDEADETNRIQEEMIVSFAEITENKSEQTGKHVKRVAEYSKILAAEMGLDGEQISQIYLASMMHDIGKLLIDAQILEKPGRLTDEEYTEIKKHSGYGGELLKSVEGDVMKLAKTIALEHHERVDGNGYPEGKSGEDISMAGKIVAVADVYDALTSKRSYKEAWEDSRAYDEIVKGSGTQFDAEVVEVFKRAYDKINAVRLQFADEK